MRHQIIQHNKFCFSKYLLKENQVQEEETMWKVYKLTTKCCDKLKQMKNDVFVNVEISYILEIRNKPHENKFTITSKTPDGELQKQPPEVFCK